MYFPVLVSREVFDKCQQRLAINQKKPVHFKQVTDKYLQRAKSSAVTAAVICPE